MIHYHCLTSCRINVDVLVTNDKKSMCVCVCVCAHVCVCVWGFMYVKLNVYLIEICWHLPCRIRYLAFCACVFSMICEKECQDICNFLLSLIL